MYQQALARIVTSLDQLEKLAFAKDKHSSGAMLGLGMALSAMAADSSLYVGSQVTKVLDRLRAAIQGEDIAHLHCRVSFNAMRACTDLMMRLKHAVRRLTTEICSSFGNLFKLYSKHTFLLVATHTLLKQKMDLINQTGMEIWLLCVFWVHGVISGDSRFNPEATPRVVFLLKDNNFMSSDFEVFC